MVKEIDLINFTRQFATLYKSGFTILSAITSLQSQTSNPALRKVIESIKRDLITGYSLSQAMAKYPKVFNELYLNCVRAGETTGYLDRIMMGIADLLESERPLKRDFRLALISPIFPIITFFLIIPAVSIIFSSSISIPNKFLFLLTFLIARYWLIILIFSVFYLFIKSKRGKSWWDEMKLKIPKVGPVISQMIFFRFSKMFEILNRTNLPVNENLSFVSRSITNSFISYHISVISETVLMGVGLASAVRASTIFPPIVVEMIATGEEIGKLEKTLTELTFHLYREAQKAVRNFCDFTDRMTIIMFFFVLLYHIRFG